MKKIISIFFCLLAVSLSAQIPSATKQLSRWQVGVYENIGAINDGGIGWIWMYDPDYDFAITAGANVEYKICKWFSLRSGAEIFRNKYHSGSGVIGPLICDAPWSGPYSYVEFNYKYLEIPFDLKFNFLTDKQINLFFSGGISNSFRYGSVYIENVWDEGTISKRNVKESFHFNKLRTNFSIGTSVRINQNIKSILEPNFWFHYRGYDLPSSPLNFFGIKLGLIYSFNKK